MSCEVFRAYETRWSALGLCRLCLRLLLRLFYLARARFGEARAGGHAGILLAEVLQHVLGDSHTEGAVGGLHFEVDLGHLRGEFLAEGRAVKLQKSLDFVLREMLIVNSNELGGSVIRIEFGSVAFDEGVHKLLAAVAGGDGGEKVFANLVGAVSGEILHRVARTDELHKGANVRFFRGINGMPRLACATLWLRGILRCALNGEEKHRHVDDDQCQDRLHECLRGENLCGFATW